MYLEKTLSFSICLFIITIMIFLNLNIIIWVIDIKLNEFLNINLYKLIQQFQFRLNQSIMYFHCFTKIIRLN